MDDTQQERDMDMRGEGNMRTTDLIRNYALKLENECIRLERECEESAAEVDMLKESCSALEENNCKQEAELEHLKFMIFTEKTNRENSLDKMSEVEDKIQEVAKLLNSGTGTLDGLNKAKEQFNQILSNKLVQDEQQENYYHHLETALVETFLQIEQKKNYLLEVKEREKQEFAKILAHSTSQIEIMKAEEGRLKVELQQKLDASKEITIMINLITPDIEKLEFETNKTKQILANEQKEGESILNQLGAELQEVLAKKEIVEQKVEAADKMIEEKHVLIQHVDVENKMLDKRLREELTKEEENIKIKNEALKRFEYLESERKAVMERFAKLLSVEKENTCGQLQPEETKHREQEPDSNTDNLENKAANGNEEMKRLDALIDKFEKERNIIIDERLTLDEKLGQVQKEMNAKAEENARESAEIDVKYKDLTEENKTLKQAIAGMELRKKDANKRKCSKEEKIEVLKVKLEEVKSLSKQMDSKVISENKLQAEKLEELQRAENDLDDMISRTKQEYKDALEDGKMCEELKKLIHNLEGQIAVNKDALEQSIKDLKYIQQKEIEEKDVEMEQQRIQYEREFRIREQRKSEALVEMKEMKLRVAELQQQKNLREADVNKAQQTLVKYDNLIKQLDRKLMNVQNIAAGNFASQSSMDPHSQSLSTPNMKHRKPESVPSPTGSEANQRVYEVKENVDVDHVLSHRKRPSNPKKAAPKTKDPDSDWGF